MFHLAFHMFKGNSFYRNFPKNNVQKLCWIISISKETSGKISSWQLVHQCFSDPRLEFQTPDCQDLVFGIKATPPSRGLWHVADSSNLGINWEREMGALPHLCVLRPLTQFGNKTKQNKTKQNKTTAIIITLVSVMWISTDAHVCPKESKLGWKAVDPWDKCGHYNTPTLTYTLPPLQGPLRSHWEGNYLNQSLSHISLLFTTHW